MQPERRQKVLSALGVVQYRKRMPPEKPELKQEASEEHQMVSKPEASVANSIQELKAVADDLKETVAPAEKQPVAEKTDEASSELTRVFELRFWRCGHLLAVETHSTKTDIDTDAVSAEAATPEAKHRLANNVFRALFGAGVTGASMYTHNWPEASVGESSTDVAAREWLSLFLQGQKAKDPDTKLWLMGEDVLELLLSEHGAPQELEGKRIVHEQLGMEVYVTVSLDQMLANPSLKAVAWKLLGSLRSIAS